MKFGDVTVEDAEGAILAHSLRHGDMRLGKGHRLDATDIKVLQLAGIRSVIAARLELGDLFEDEAASRIAAAIFPEHLTLSPATTGRVNIFAAGNGLFRAWKDVVDRLNRIDPGITLACLRDHADVRAGDMVATIKIIPLAVSGHAVEQAVALLSGEAAFAVRPYSVRRVALIATQLPSLKPSVMDKTRQVLNARLAASGSQVTTEVRVAHAEDAVRQVIADAVADHDMIIVFGASAVIDPDDVIPAAIRAARGVVHQVGLPVDPGNLLVYGEVGSVPVIGAPGCARSPKENGFDWVLNRILAGEKIEPADLTGLGVGGLLMEIPTRPRPRLAGDADKRQLHVAALVLAAGSASRMAASGSHKLLAEFDGVPLVRRSVETTLASAADSTVVVTGYRADDIGVALEGTGSSLVFNPDFASGMASSLRAGLAAVRDHADAVLVVLADMPGVTTEDLDRMLESFRASGGRAIVRAVSGGKRGNPVILPAPTFEAISRLEGDIGARPIIEKSGLDIIDIDIGPAAHLDTDTPAEIIAAGGILKG